MLSLTDRNPLDIVFERKQKTWAVRRIVLPWGPDGFQMATAAYAGSLALAVLLSPQNDPAATGASLMVMLGIPKVLWGIFLLGYALIGVSCLIVSAPWRKATLATVSVAIFTMLCVWTAWQSYLSGVVLQDAVFQFLLAVGSLVSLVQRIGE